MTQSLFGQYLKFVSAGHVMFVVGLMMVSSLRGCFQAAPVTMPLMFTVEVPAENPAPFVGSKPPAHEEPKQPKDVVEPIPSRTPPVRRTKPQVTTRTSGVQVSSNRVIRAASGGGRRPRSAFSPEELKRIEALLAAGATPSDRTVIPGEEEMCLLRIKNTLYNAWQNRPSVDESGDSATEITIKLGPDGSIVSRRISRKSGHGPMDESALAAVNSVTRIEGLTGEFLQRHNYEITVAFRLEGEAAGGL